MVHHNPNPSSEETLEELKRVVTALPKMPKNIVDDTRHEKVLSYVSAFIALRDPVLLQTMLVQWSILDIFQACLALDQDYRVSCVALRLLGYLLEYDTAPQTANNSGDSNGIWQLLEARYPIILEFLIENTAGEEALSRYSCWFALERIVQYDDGARWLLNTGRCADMVSAALKDTSTYVLSASCRFLVAIIENRSIDAGRITAHDKLLDTLLESIALYKLIHTMMTDQESERNRVAGLEFLWMLADSRSDRGAEFLGQSQLFFSYMDLLMDDSRLVRSRALEILSTLLESTSNPLNVLGKDLTTTDSMELDKSDDQAKIESLQETSKIHQNMATAIRTDTIVVQGTGKLAQQLNQLEFQDTVQAQSCAKPSRGPAAARGGTLPKTVVLSALKALQSLATLFPRTVERSASLNVVLSVLFDQKLCSDQRVFKACLTTLPSVLKTKVQNGQLLDEQHFAEAMTVILKLLQRPATGSTSLKLILTAIVEFFTDDTLGKILAHEKAGLDLANGLGLKLYDMEWDVRDNVVEFIGALFQAGGPDHGVEWALKHDLLESIFQKLSDEEAYVRAASVHAFETVMRDSRGWKGMCSKNLDERLSVKLPSLIRDSEAFVRRAVLEAMICLVSERESGTILMINGTDLFVDAAFMSRLSLDDSDWEVRIRACEFIAAVWEHCLALDERADYRIRVSKRLKDSASEQDKNDSIQNLGPSSWWFYDIKGDQILVEATRDSSRMVRLTTVEILKKMKVSIDQRMGSVPPQNSFEPKGMKDGATVEHEHQDNNTKSEELEGSSNRLGKRPVAEDISNESTRTASAYGTSSTHPHAKFYAILKSLDFERLDATTSVEELYEEVLNIERVEDVVMAENENPNDGNNVLDCY
ncbi:BRCA1-associated ATM activator 1 [Modicella reniformis]|uniref:BRCA1-associated ATM activator 1 n=1 Tax=Modicella reniformis TaxID=1440133 RepID=A0A9P6SVJ9_9FUNG|nr:BRCA1-associated ATM activator 1 [Modicella reniformis]